MYNQPAKKCEICGDECVELAYLTDGTKNKLVCINCLKEQIVGWK